MTVDKSDAADAYRFRWMCAQLGGKSVDEVRKWFDDQMSWVREAELLKDMLKGDGNV